jgi:ribosome biogenesis GTPase
MSAEVSGKFRHEARGRGDFPSVGDWVAVEPRPNEAKATIHAVLPRRTRFSRKEAGARTEEQVLAANVDVALLVSGLDGGRNFNPSRIERCLTLCYESGVEPVIILNKRDVCEDLEAFVREAEEIAFGVPVLAVSALTREGLDALTPHLGAGRTAALLGTSGVGKSSLINAMLGEERLTVNEVRDDDRRGRHTTTWRELILLPAGGVIIDTPGMRELQLWGDEDALAGSFADVGELSQHCRFRDCTHTSEPGCAVLAAVESGTLAPERLEHFRQQQKEFRYLARKQDQRARQIEQSRWKTIRKSQKRFNREDPKRK